MAPFVPLSAIGLSLAILHATPVLADQATFRVMLQGKSAAAFADIVDQVVESGAEITHRLPIINAVGARVSASQLDTIMDSAAIARLIDDLDANAREPEKPADASGCSAAGALELRYESTTVQWRLYNKGDRPLNFNGVNLKAPATLGDVRSAAWSETPLVARPGGKNVSDNVHFSPETPIQMAAHSDVHVTFDFGVPTDPKKHPQSGFTLNASFASDCSVELIPGYPDNSADTYYPTVAGADLLHRYGITGQGIAVAVLDSGLWEPDSIALDTNGRSRIIARYDAVADAPGVAFDESGHGTHMTSIIAQSGRVANQPGGSFRGIAPDVDIVSVKAFEADGQGDFLNIVRGLQWVYDNREALDIRVLNLSFAARPRWPYWLDPINQAVMRLWQAGIVIVAAAGNEGPESMTVGSPGNLPYIITVGSVTDSWTTETEHDDYIPDFSSRGPTPTGHIKPDIVAPGGHMSGITRPGSTLLEQFPEYLLTTGDFVMTGTSQSAAVVSGLVALLLQTDPTLSPDDVKCALLSSANPAINLDGKLSYSPFQQGSGYVNIQRAITLGEKGCGNAGMNIDNDIQGKEFFRGPALLDDIDNPTLPDLDLIFDGDASEKGMSANRRWGVKAHVERLKPGDEQPQRNSATPDWRQIYESEKAIIDRLKNPGQN